MTGSRAVKYIGGMNWLATILSVIALILPSAGPASSHDPGKARNATEAAVFNFYQTWYRIPERTYSCCDMKDCHIVEIRREGERYYFLDNVYEHAWRPIPPDRLEHNAKDPRESPDGSSHVCFNSMFVLCAVLGSGQ